MVDYESELTQGCWSAPHSLFHPLDWPASPRPTPNHIGLSLRDLATDNTINIIFGVLAFILGVLSVAFA